MFSLRKLALLALAGFAVAVPMAQVDSSSLAGVANAGVEGVAAGLGQVGMPRQIDSSSPANMIAGVLGGSPLPELPVRRAESRSIVVVLEGVVADVQVIAATIIASVRVKADVEVDVIVERLGAIVVVLEGAIAEIKVIVADPVGFVVNIEELAVVLSALLVVVLRILYVVSLVPVLATTAVAALTINIGGLLAALISVIIPVAGGVVVLIVPRIYTVISFLYVLDLTVVIRVLALPSAA